MIRFDGSFVPGETAVFIRRFAENIGLHFERQDIFARPQIQRRPGDRSSVERNRGNPEFVFCGGLVSGLAGGRSIDFEFVNDTVDVAAFPGSD